jgi:hypothetical protein
MGEGSDANSAGGRDVGRVKRSTILGADVEDGTESSAGCGLFGAGTDVGVEVNDGSRASTAGTGGVRTAGIVGAEIGVPISPKEVA